MQCHKTNSDVITMTNQDNGMCCRELVRTSSWFQFCMSFIGGGGGAGGKELCKPFRQCTINSKEKHVAILNGTRRHIAFSFLIEFLNIAGHFMLSLFLGIGNC